jgi:hypothetical protein
MWGRQFWRQAGLRASASGAAWKGRLPPKLAAPQGRMNHPIYRISAFEIVANYTLRIRFDDESEQTIDFRPDPCAEIYTARCAIWSFSIKFDLIQRSTP